MSRLTERAKGIGRGGGGCILKHPSNSHVVVFFLSQRRREKCGKGGNGVSTTFPMNESEKKEEGNLVIRNLILIDII